MNFTKHIVSVSLGSSARNHSTTIKLLGQEIKVERMGTDGDLGRAEQLLGRLDGNVDVLSLGGINFYLVCGKKYFIIKDSLKLCRAVRNTPLVDGTRIKASWEKNIVQYLQKHYGWPQVGQYVLVTSVLDRFGLTRGFQEAGCRLIIGDAMFALGIPLPFYSTHLFNLTAALTLPFLRRLPIGCLYPLGKDQAVINPRFNRYYRQADILAGDFHFLRRHMPGALEGKMVVTSTVTPGDRVELQRRGVRCLVTMSPEIDGRAFGANVMEALCVALLEQPLDKISPDMCAEILTEAGIRPGIHLFK